MSRVIALAVIVALSGCSVALQKRPSHTAVAECTSSNAYWIADYVGVAAGTAGFVYGLANQEKSDAKMAAGSAAGLAAILYLASAMNGQRWTSQCREQRESAPVASR